MKKMKPFKLTPVFKDYIWGGTKLCTKYNKKTDISPVAESWELSCHKDGCSIADGGDYDGQTLDAIIKRNPEILGTYCKDGELPVLIKLIDARDNLSVQVHPTDIQANDWEGQNGKTEMWYVIEAEKGAKITYGVSSDISKDALKKAIKEKTVETFLNTVPTKKGDVFFVDAGTIHAIGKGNLIAEIQQNSNVTYRLYDYGRVDKNGKERELHIEKGIKTSDCTPVKIRKTPNCSDGTRLLGSCKYFAVKEVKVSGSKTFVADEKSYHAVIVTEGNVEISCHGFCEKVYAGETVFIPALVGEYTLTGEATVLITTNQPKYCVKVVSEEAAVSATVTDEYGVIYGSVSMDKDCDITDCARVAADESGIDFEDIEGVEYL